MKTKQQEIEIIFLNRNQPHFRETGIQEIDKIKK